jgi:putative acetyltransferase
MLQPQVFAEIVIRRCNPDAPEVRALLAELDGYLNYLYPSISNPLMSIAELRAPEVIFLVAREGDKLLGCGALVQRQGYGEIKRMMVSPAARGKGLGSKILHAIEAQALAYDLQVLRLETGTQQPESIALYQRAGYFDIAPFGDYQQGPQSRFMEKRLAL